MGIIRVSSKHVGVTLTQEEFDAIPILENFCDARGYANAEEYITYSKVPTRYR